MTEESVDPYESAVAVVGMSGRFPGAGDVAALWRNVLEGRSGLREATDEELAAAGVGPAEAADPHYVRVTAPVDGVADFDAGVFGFSPREAETMDPQHRLFLECCWQALESAGYPPVEPPGTVGVFGGSGFPDYLLQNVEHVTKEPGGGLLVAVGNERDSLASLAAYKLGLRGPSLGVQTFCSTSLVAVHLACQSLLTFECDTALAGGAFLPLPHPSGYRYEPGGITSPGGRVRSFDADADGTVMGAGVGVVALRRMADALADGDVVHAVILGSAVNNDGPARVGYTAPGVDGQAAVIRTALEVADVPPESVGYVECHATGTSLGDGIELAAMARVFQRPPTTPTVLGSAKPTLGHLDRASGVTGLIRAVLSLREGVQPAMPGFERPNPALAAAADRFTVLRENRPWPEGPGPRRAGVSSFGLGGTNAHVVLEQAPPRRARPASPGPHLLAFSAADTGALDDVGARLRDHLAAHPGLGLADVAFTLQVSRGHFAVRRYVVCDDPADALKALGDPARQVDGETTRRVRRVRLTAGTGVAARWWDELADAVGRLLPQPASGGNGPETEGGPGPDGALAALAGGLRAVGVRVAAVDGPDGDGPEGDAVREVTVSPAAGQDAAHWLVDLLGRLWLAGAEPDWAALHRGAAARVELPTYPFRRRRYWTAPAPRALLPEPERGRVDDVGRWTYLPAWQPRPLPTAGLDERLRAAGPWLVLAAEERGEALVRRLVRAGAEVIAARPGEEFGQDANGDWTLPADALPGAVEDLLAAQYVAPRTVVHGLALAAREGDGAAHFTAEQERGLHPALALVGALVADPLAPPAEVVLLTSGAVSVAGADLVHPEHAALAALAPTIAQENPQLGCRHVDLDPVPGVPDGTGQVLAAIVHPHEGPTAVRAGELFARAYRQVPLERPAADRPVFRAGETVLVTGGLGDVGLVLARHLAGAYGCRLVLTSRTELPARERWEQVAREEGRTARHVRNLLALEQEGVEVLAAGADVGDEDAMRAVVAAAEERFGGIDAVVHAAGVQDPRWFRMAHLSDRDTCTAHLHAKVAGFHVLQAVLGDRAADRRITLSSLSAVLGGIALGPYSAANASLDAYARRARLRGEGRWVSVDWDTWAIDPERLEAHHNPVVRAYEMAPAEGVDVLERALAAADGIGQVVVSSGPIGPRLEQWVVGAGTPAAPEQDAQAERHARPDLPTPYAEPAEGTEAELARIWGAVLGVAEVGANDDFFDLGGHSLLAIQLSARVRAALPVELAATDLLENPTVRRLAAALAG